MANGVKPTKILPVDWNYFHIDRKDFLDDTIFPLKSGSIQFNFLSLTSKIDIDIDVLMK